MVKALKGSDLIELLLKELECPNKAQLAKRLNMRATSIQSWENADLTKTLIRNVIRKVRDSAVNRSIVPIVEFRQLNHLHGHSSDTLRKKIDSDGICQKLNKSKGIY